MLIFLNLFVAIILEGYIEIIQKEDKGIFSLESTEAFRDVWSHYDENATGNIYVSKFKNFMFELGRDYPRIGWDETKFSKNKVAIKKRIDRLNLKTIKMRGIPRFEYNNVLECLARDALIRATMETQMGKDYDIDDEDNINKEQEIKLDLNKAKDNE